MNLHIDMLFQMNAKRVTLSLCTQVWDSNPLSKIAASLQVSLNHELPCSCWASPRAQTVGSQSFKENVAQIFSFTVVYATV